MIEIRCCHTLADAEPFRAALNALNLAAARPDPFSTFEFYESYVRRALAQPGGERLRLWLLLAFEGEALIGYAALKHSEQRVLGLRAAKLDWLTAHAADRPHVVARPEQARPVAAALYAYLLGRKRQWGLLEFQQQESDSPLLPPPAWTASGACRFQQWPNLANGTIPVRWDSTADYFAALSKKARSNVSRQMRNLLAAGEVRMLTSSHPPSMPALLALYRSIESHGWKARADATTRKDSVTHADATAPDPTMRPVIQLLLLDGLPIAGLICGAFDKSLYALHIVYDERHAHLGPGSAVLLMGVRLAIEGGYECFNLLRGAGYYKERWLADMSETRSLQIYRVTSPFFWRRAFGDARRHWFRKAEQGAPAPFNPARRELGQAVVADTADASERAQQATLLAQVLSGHGEFLSAADLARVLPFATQRKPPDLAIA